MYVTFPIKHRKENLEAQCNKKNQNANTKQNNNRQGTEAPEGNSAPHKQQHTQQADSRTLCRQKTTPLQLCNSNGKQDSYPLQHASTETAKQANSAPSPRRERTNEPFTTECCSRKCFVVSSEQVDTTGPSQTTRHNLSQQTETSPIRPRTNTKPRCGTEHKPLG